MEEEKTLDVSWGTILKIAVVFLVFYIIYSIKDILVWVLFALIISILFNPIIDFLEKKRIPRTVATIFVYVTLFAVLSSILYLTIPAFIGEIQQFSQLFPQYFEKLAPPLRGLQISAFESFDSFTRALQDWLIRVSSSIFGALVSIFGGIFSTITIFAIAIFFSIEKNDVDGAIELLSPAKKESYFLSLWKRAQVKTAAWFGTRILSSISVGLMSYLTLKIFSIKYAFLLALFAGVMEIVPVLGPIVSGLIILILTAVEYPPKVLIVLIAIVLIQQIESNVITPVLTKKMVGLPAILVIVSLLIGARLWGFLGAILAIPLTGVIYEFLRDFLRKRKEEKISVV